MALWDRVKSWVNEHILETPALETQVPDEPILPEEPLGGYPEEPLEGGENPITYEDSDEQITIVDDYGIFRGEMTFEEWWNASLLTSEQFHERFGYDFYNVELIYLLEEQLDIDWDWDSWREKYAGAMASG